MNKESPDTFFVVIDFIAWGKKATVVHMPDKYPNISPKKLFMFSSFFMMLLYHTRLNKSAYIKFKFCFRYIITFMVYKFFYFFTTQ